METSAEHTRPRDLLDAERLIQQEFKRQQQRNARELTKSRAPVVVGHPRSVSQADRRVQQQNLRLHQRQPRDTVRVRGIGATMRPAPSDTVQIQHREKTYPVADTTASATPALAAASRERVSASQLTWIALFLSIAALLLVGLFSAKKFGPQFEVQEVQFTQQQLAADIENLRHVYQIERVKNRMLNARLQLLVYNNYARAEVLLSTARQGILDVSRSVTKEQQQAVKQVLNNIDVLLQELHRKPLPFDQRLDEITSILENL
jgi:hypothetical protein